MIGYKNKVNVTEVSFASHQTENDADVYLWLIFLPDINFFSIHCLSSSVNNF